jgi:hypothetical protein
LPFAGSGTREDMWIALCTPLLVIVFALAMDGVEASFVRQHVRSARPRYGRSLRTNLTSR